jgi:hypothetical protein
MKTFECGVEPFVIFCESAEACGPGEAALDDPTSALRSVSYSCGEINSWVTSHLPDASLASRDCSYVRLARNPRAFPEAGFISASSTLPRPGMSFSNYYLANFCANCMAHSCVWASFPQFRKRRESSPCSASKCCGHILRGNGHSAPWLLKPRFPTEQP